MKFDPSFFSSAYTVIAQIQFELLYQVGGAALVLLKLPIWSVSRNHSFVKANNYLC